MTISANTVWEVQTGGSDNNGGGFVAGASGTDFSQQAAPAMSATDFMSGGIGSTIIQSLGTTPNSLTGNIVQLISGTNLVPGFYEIVSQLGSLLTLDRAPDDGVGGLSGVTGNVGGALASPGQASNAVGAGSTFRGQGIWIKSGTYTLTSSSAHVSGGLFQFSNLADRKFLRGYGTTRGDGIQATINAGAITTVSVITRGGGRTQEIRNLIVDGNSNASVVGFDGNQGFNGSPTENCKALNCTTGFQGTAVSYQNCVADTCGTGFTGTSGAELCVAKNCTGIGIDLDDHVTHCISHNNNVGFNTTCPITSHCIAYGNASDGFFHENSRPGNYRACIAYGNGGYGFNIQTAGFSFGSLFHCASGSNTSGRTNGGEAIDDDGITLTADPFTNAASADFSINDTAGGGTLLRADTLTLDGTTTISGFLWLLSAVPTGGRRPRLQVIS